MISVTSFYFCSLVSSSCHVCVHCDLLDSSQMCQVLMLPSSAPWKLTSESGICYYDMSRIQVGRITWQ